MNSTSCLICLSVSHFHTLPSRILLVTGGKRVSGAARLLYEHTLRLTSPVV